MIVVDLEMSGTDVRKCGIWQVGAIEFENPQNIFLQEARLEDEYEFVLEGNFAMKKPEEIFGKTEEELRDKNKQSEKQLLKNFFEWVSKIKEKVFVCQNSMDLEFLNDKCRKYKLPKPHWRFIELQTVAQTIYYQKNNKLLLSNNGQSDMGLGNAANLVGLEDKRTIHTALEDAKFEAEILSRLLNKRNLLQEYSEYKILEN